MTSTRVVASALVASAPVLFKAVCVFATACPVSLTRSPNARPAAASWPLTSVFAMSCPPRSSDGERERLGESAEADQHRHLDRSRAGVGHVADDAHLHVALG